MTEKEYRQADGISRSELWRLNPDNGGTPEKFKWLREHPAEPTPALIFGRLVHTLFLTPELLNAEFALAPAVDRRTKAGREAYAMFLEELNDRQEIRAEDLDRAAEMVEVLHRSPFVTALMAGAEREKPLFWRDAFTGEDCKVRLDALTEIGDRPIIIDYKTAADASADGFLRHALKYGYDFQSGMYSEAIRVRMEKEPRFVFIVQEKEAPYSVNILEADAQFILRGTDKFRELLGIYHECNLTGNWYGLMGPDPVITSLILPAWAGGDKIKEGNKMAEKNSTEKVEFKTIRQMAATGIISEGFLRGMVKRGECPGVWSGNRFLVNVKRLLETLDEMSVVNKREE